MIAWTYAVPLELTDTELLAEFERVVAEVRAGNAREIAAIVRNLVTLRCEERANVAIFRPWAFVKGALTLTTTAANNVAKR